MTTEFAEAAERHLDDVHAFLVYLTGDRNVAEDLTAETFARALERWRRFDPRRGSPRAWLCQLARSTALDHFRAEERRRRREGRFAARERREDAGPVFGDGLSAELEQALARLSAAEREVVALRVVLELDGEMAARVLGISATACSTRLSRALQKLEKEVSAGVAA
ncbi:MAG TPA: RNA polymerase sigma factor [Gaiellaceae bacterium]|nr:RNA polymerase sigma factor [Gaiellaceae bacterium]